MAAASTTLLAQFSYTPFVGVNVGTPTYSGSVTTNANGTLTITGGGADIWNASDDCFYYYTAVTGLEWDARMQVRSFTGPDTWSKVELMVRRPATPGGAPAGPDAEMNVSMTQPAVSVADGGTGENDVEWQWRGASGGSSYNAAYGGASDTYPNEYARIVRLGSVFNLYWSTDGVNWSLVGSQDTSTTANHFDGTPWENPILVGVAVTSHNDGGATLGDAVITNLSVVPIIAPTSVGVVSQISGTTNVYAYAEASFTFVATNNATPLGDVGMSYTWYKNGQVASSNLLTTNYTFLTTAADNGAQIYAVASPLGYSSITVTSAVLTLTANPGAQIYTNGLKHELWANATRTQVENGDVPAANTLSLASAPDFNIEGINGGNNYAERLSGYFIPPTTAAYVFFLNSDDDSDLFISSNSSPTNKYLIAQETVWSNPYDWLVSDGGGVAGQKRSDLYSPDGGVTFPYANGINLVASNLYYLEAVHHQGTGGANLGVTYQTTNQIADPNWATVFTNGTYPLLEATNGNIAIITFPGTTLVWTLQPTNETVNQGDTANLSANAASDSELNVQYQWYLNGAPYTNGGTGSTLSLPLVPITYNGAQIFVVASLAESSLAITSSTVKLTVQQAVLELGFAKDERWNNSSRAAIENGAVGAPNYTMAVPAWAVNTGNNDYVNNIGRRVSGYFVPPSNGLYVFFLNSDDDSDLFLSTDDTPANKRLIAQESGWSNPWNWESVGGGSTISQKRSDQWSPNGGVTQPYASGISLLGGKHYYMEQDYSQGGGGENLEATFKLTTDPDPVSGAAVTRLTGNAIAINAVRCSYVAFTEQPSNVVAQAYANATFNALGITDSQLVIGQTTGDEASYTNSFMFYQWYTNGAAVSGANTGTLVLGSVLPDYNGLQISCQIRSLGYSDTNLNPIWSNSLPATLTVVTGAAPSLVYASVVTNNLNSTNLLYPAVVYVDVVFSGPIDPTALTNANNYLFSAGSGLTSANITSITVLPGNTAVELALNQSPILPFTVTVSSMSGWGGGPPLAGSTVTNVNTVELASLDIGGVGTTLSGADPAVPSRLYVDGPAAYTVQCEGSDIYNAFDGFNFLYETKSGNFDVVVRQIKTTHVSNWTKGGLMVREVLDEFSRNYSLVNDPDSADGIQALDGSGYGANTVECNAREDYSGATAGWEQHGPSQPPTYPNAWLRMTLQRITNSVGTNLVVQDILTAYSSTNGVNWEQLAQTDIATNGTAPASLADPAYIGICTTAHDNDPVGGYTGEYLDTAVYANYNSSYVPVVPAQLSVSLSGPNLIVSWTPAGGRLQSSPAVAGPDVNWQTVATGGGSYTNTASASAMFFRVVNP